MYTYTLVFKNTSFVLPFHTRSLNYNMRSTLDAARWMLLGIYCGVHIYIVVVVNESGVAGTNTQTHFHLYVRLVVECVNKITEGIMSEGKRKEVMGDTFPI